MGLPNARYKRGAYWSLLLLKILPDLILVSISYVLVIPNRGKAKRDPTLLLLKLPHLTGTIWYESQTIPCAEQNDWSGDIAIQNRY